jgi:hypothetical protein
MHIAAGYGFLGLVRLLRDQGAEIDKSDDVSICPPPPAAP